MHFLLGIDGSEGAFLALDRTIERVLETGDDLTVAILESSEPGQSVAEPSVAEPSVAEVESRIAERLAESTVDAEVVTLSGHPGGRLVEFAERQGHDHIVIGGEETSPLGKVKIGPLAEFVLLNAEVSVTILR